MCIDIQVRMYQILVLKNVKAANDINFIDIIHKKSICSLFSYVHMYLAKCVCYNFYRG